MSCQVEQATTGWPLRSFLVLGSLLSAVPCARLHTRMVVKEWGLSELADTSELVVSELATNALIASAHPDGSPRYEHDLAGMPVIQLRLFSDRVRLVVAVWDTHPNPPIARQATAEQEHGRGLVLVEALSERWSWGVVQGWRGKVVWAELGMA